MGSQVLHNIRVRVVTDVQPLAFGSSLYIRYNTAAHIVYSTHNSTILLSDLHTDLLLFKVLLIDLII